MKLLLTPGGGTKIIYDVGDEVIYSTNLIVSDFLEDGTRFLVQEVIPANIHKMHDQHRYIVSANRNGQNIDLILNEIYLRG